jgi:anti-sigma-K factor RskA
MNNFSEIESELRKLRPAQPSPILFERVEEAMMNRSAVVSSARQPEPLPYNWLSWGIGLAAAAVLVLFAAIKMERQQSDGKEIAQISREPETAPLLNRFEESTSSDKFVPAGATRLVYNTRDEGLQFGRGSAQPVRRFRYQTRETWQWRNPTTGASLRVSYPSEEVVLIPVSGQ